MLEYLSLAIASRLFSNGTTRAVATVGWNLDRSQEEPLVLSIAAGTSRLSFRGLVSGLSGIRVAVAAELI